MIRMKQDGIRDVIIQPTHVINGLENEQMVKDALEFSEEFSSVRFGTPLLTDDFDHEDIIKAVTEEFSDLSEEDMLVLMGHHPLCKFCLCGPRLPIQGPRIPEYFSGDRRGISGHRHTITYCSAEKAPYRYPGSVHDCSWRPCTK